MILVPIVLSILVLIVAITVSTRVIRTNGDRNIDMSFAGFTSVMVCTEIAFIWIGYLIILA